MISIRIYERVNEFEEKIGENTKVDKKNQMENKIKYSYSGLSNEEKRKKINDLGKVE